MNKTSYFHQPGLCHLTAVEMEQAAINCSSVCLSVKCSLLSWAHSGGSASPQPSSFSSVTCLCNNIFPQSLLLWCFMVNTDTGHQSNQHTLLSCYPFPAVSSVLLTCYSSACTKAHHLQFLFTWLSRIIVSYSTSNQSGVIMLSQ